MKLLLTGDFLREIYKYGIMFVAPMRVMMLAYTREDGE